MAGEQEIRGTKNLGLIQAIYVGINPPINTKIIWYDDNVGVKIHKYYDVTISQWVPFGFNGSLISLSTILVNDLTSGGTTKALTAEMGKTLKGLIDGKASIAHSHPISDVTGLLTALDDLQLNKEDKSNKNIANGYAGLDSSGKIIPTQLPALAITDTFVVNSQAAMLALVAEVGDVAVRTDLNKSFILRVTGASTLANWQELLTPVSVDQTIIDGSTNAVSGNAVFDGLEGKAPIVHTHTVSQITDFAHTHTISEVINLQNELNSKENISNKVNIISGNSSTEYPTEKAVVDYVSSELNLLKNPDRITENTGFTLVGQDITMNSLWKGVISGVEYSNPTSQVINLPLSTVANTRADIIVLTKNNNFIRVQGVESTTNPPIPSVPNDTLLAVTVIVNDSSVGNITNPISGDEYVKKIEFGNVLLTGSGVINQLDLVDEKATIVFKGSITQLNTISYASVPYNGKRITLFNAQATPVTIGHSVSGYGVDFIFPDGQDYVLKPNETIEFSFDITYAPYAHHMLIGAVVDSQIEVNSSRSVSNLWNAKTILFTANCTITVPATLLPQFGFVFRTLAGVTVTWTITAPFTWETTPTTTPEKTTGSFMRRGNTNTILLDF